MNDLRPRSQAEAERWAINDACARHADLYEDLTSVRSPGWFQANCDCGWYTTGRESVCDDALYEHMHDEHPDWWQPLIEAPSPFQRSREDRLREHVAAIVEELAEDERIGIPPHVPLLIAALRAALDADA